MGPHADPAHAPVPSQAKFLMKQTNSDFMRGAYEVSPWHSTETDTDGSILTGKPKTSHD